MGGGSDRPPTRPAKRTARQGNAATTKQGRAKQGKTGQSKGACVRSIAPPTSLASSLAAALVSSLSGCVVLGRYLFPVASCVCSLGPGQLICHSDASIRCRAPACSFFSTSAYTPRRALFRCYRRTRPRDAACAWSLSGHAETQRRPRRRSSDKSVGPWAQRTSWVQRHRTIPYHGGRRRQRWPACYSW